MKTAAACGRGVERLKKHCLFKRKVRPGMAGLGLKKNSSLRQGWQKTFAYEAAQKSKIGNRQIHNPWQNPSFSKCEIYQSTEFPKEGKEEVLSPSALSDYFKKLKK